MAIQGNNGLLYSMDSEDLINEAVKDYQEFGNIEVRAFFKKMAGVKLFTDYVFINEEQGDGYKKLIRPDEKTMVISLRDLLFALKAQNHAV